MPPAPLVVRPQGAAAPRAGDGRTNDFSRSDVSEDGNRAFGRWHTLEAATLKDRSTQVWMAAWYENDFMRTDGQWLISHLRYRDRFVCPYEDGWAKVRYISPQTLESLNEVRIQE